MQVYKAVAECFIFRLDYQWSNVHEANELVIKLQHWICNNCGNCNVNTYINGKFTTSVTVCILCGMDQIDQIVLKLRKHDSYLMVNQMNIKRHVMDSKGSDHEDQSVEELIDEAIEAGGPFNLLCPNQNYQQPCRAILRLAKSLIRCKRWLYTINRKKGGDDMEKTVKAD
eukprot:228975_1